MDLPQLLTQATSQGHQALVLSTNAASSSEDLLSKNGTDQHVVPVAIPEGFENNSHKHDQKYDSSFPDKLKQKGCL